MSDESAGASAPEDERRQEKGPTFTGLARGYWEGATRRTALGLSAAIVGLVGANVLVAFLINRWNASFFDALDKKIAGQMGMLALVFLGLVAVGAAVNGVLVLARMRLQISWRRWLSDKLIARWLGERTYYKLNIVEGDHDNPQFRIAEDVRLAIEPLVDFAIGLLNALLGASTFLAVLWVIGGGAELSVGSVSLYVPGLFVVAAILYALLMSGLTVMIGQPLISSVEEKNEKEADLRFEMTRIRESAESIALIGGEEQERKRIDTVMDSLFGKWRRLIWNHARLMVATNSNAILLPVVPLLIGAPKYISGDISLGQLMQVAAAFVQVQLAFNWIMDNFVRLAEWRASANRVVGLVRGMDLVSVDMDSRNDHRIEIGDSPDRSIRLIDLTVERLDGDTVIDEADVTIGAGDSVMLAGESGTGKSTLIRAIAGLWPWGSGKVLLPRDARIFFLPQRPYIPLGPLRNAVAYPEDPAAYDDEQFAKALARCGLAHLVERLDESDRWDQILSGGEQQRVGFVRLALAKPDVVILDEATSALDGESQASMMEMFRGELAHATLISVSHRPELAAYHSKTLMLRRRPNGAQLQMRDGTDGEGGKYWTRWRKAMALLATRRHDGEVKIQG